MKTRIKKTALFMAILGLIVTLVTGYFGYKQYELVSEGTLVNGEVIEIITVRGDDSTTYKPKISYRWNREDLTYTPSFSSNISAHRVGDVVPLRVSEKGVTINGIHSGYIGLGMGLVFGLLFFVIGITWMRRHIKRYDQATRLKRYGKKVHARFVRKDVTNYKINNQAGTILYLQEEKSNRVFQSRPIFSEFSVRWLEEHIFDVYVDTKNPDEYYIDLEKHFGEPKQN